MLVTLTLTFILTASKNIIRTRRIIDDVDSLVGRKFFIRRRDEDTSASLVQVQRLLSSPDGIPRLQLTTLSSLPVSSSNDPRQHITPDSDYMLTVEELSKRTDDAITKQDLVPIAVTEHRNTGIQPVVLVTWNTNE